MKTGTKKPMPYVGTPPRNAAESSAERTAGIIWRAYWRKLDTLRGRREHGEALQRAAMADAAAAQRERDARPVLDLEAGRRYANTQAAAKALRVSVKEVRAQLAACWLVWPVDPMKPIERVEAGNARPNLIARHLRSIKPTSAPCLLPRAKAQGKAVAA